MILLAGAALGVALALWVLLPLPRSLTPPRIDSPAVRTAVLEHLNLSTDPTHDPADTDGIGCPWCAFGAVAAEARDAFESYADGRLDLPGLYDRIADAAEARHARLEREEFARALRTRLGLVRETARLEDARDETGHR